MRSVPTSLRRALAALAVVIVSLPVVAGAAAADAHSADGAPPEAPDASGDQIGALAEEDRLVPFPGVPGVDLVALGYEGAPLDAEAIARIGETLPDEPRERVAELFQRLELGAPQRDGLVEAQGLLRTALAEFDPSVGRLRAAVEVAELHRTESSRRLNDARQRLTERRDGLADHRRQMAEVAIEAYMRPPGSDAMAAVLGGVATTTSDLSAGVLFTAKADHDGIVEEDIELALAVAGERRAQVAGIAADAAERHEAAESALATVEERREAHRRALEAVEIALITLDSQLPALQADLDQTIEETWGVIEDLAGIDVAGELPIVSVGGIRIHAAVAPKLQALLAHAHSEGIDLGGWGYRSNAQQIELRRKHCGPTPEDIFLKPSGACSPPTARPGASLHERGLAVDFHLGGRSISTRRSPAFEWLAANAALYGFHNLPSEPWHWSVNGQ